ncbi:histidine phosphatase superfamily (branch 1) domain-containing protein [Ditylenchus destructor]|uniref:Histidine phosphatase superfamily (Branch 1) domain-containing protein n=1 Tax=Ditylenchus destructor TaxID=166010 RepID=A0AAD4MZY9_9BILA|nr:histidine phosphatase superfamily (branch 1) domain-containing protein [Ditylenchus destructor]
MISPIDGLPKIELAKGLSISNPKTLIAVTNGECISEIFPEWTSRAYLGPSVPYKPYDLNMPIKVPRRSRHANRVDSPLTEHGKIVSAIVARNLQRANFTPDRILCSPELRSVETAIQMAAFFNANFKNEEKSNIPVLVEPALAEWRNFDEEQTEKHWLTNQELQKIGYKIQNDDFGYQEVFQTIYLPTVEKPSQYFDRLMEFLGSVLDKFDGCSVLIGSSGLTTLLNNQRWKKADDLQKIRAKTPTCSIVVRHFPTSDHEENTEDFRIQPHTNAAQLKPFTRTLNEAKQKRRALVSPTNGTEGV